MRWVISLINRLPLNNKRRIKSGNVIDIKGLSFRSKLKIAGTGNSIRISDFARIMKCKIEVSGCYNTIIIGENAFLENVELHIEDNNGSIVIGDRTIMSGYTHLAVIEGTTLSIGTDCLFSSGVTIRTGDSHSVIDDISRQRINPSLDVKIGNHVWVGNGATILKGVIVENDSVVATKAVVTKSLGSSKCIAGGNPARIIKRNVSWLANRIKMEE